MEGLKREVIIESLHTQGTHMKLLIAGGTGFVGQALVTDLKKSHQITVLSRNSKKSLKLFLNIATAEWTDKNLKNIVADVDVVIILVGENIGEKRWSSATKSKIINSRTIATKKLCNIIQSIDKENRPRLFNANAIGIYGLQKTLQQQNDTIYSEESKLPTPPSDFLSSVGRDWELPLHESNELDIVKLRFSVILDPAGGMLKKVSLPFRLGLGGRVGSGKQPFSWISLDDVVGIISFLLENPSLNGPFNLVAPRVVNQQQFATIFAKHLNRPAIFPLPTFIVKLLFGQMGQELLLSGQNVISKNLKDYKFKYRTLEQAMNHWYK